jgi:hypothetical protein
MAEVTDTPKKAKRDTRKNNFRYFIWWGAVLFPVLVMLNTTLFWFIFARDQSFFFVLAAAIVVSWILILTLYYVWAIYFYNINRGWTDEDWDDHDSKVLVHGTGSEPERNPNSEETLGLPPGTVRGTIALSVLVGGMAMMVASLAMPGRLEQNEFLVDNFEYIKTAFLMVIAFYFGTKSLEFISRKQVLGGASTATGEESAPAPSTAAARNDKVAPAAGAPAVTVAGDISKGNAAATDFEDPTAQG